MATIHHRERGFTLTELLIGMSVTLVVFSGVLGVLRDAAGASASAVSTTDVNQTMRLAMNVVIRDLVQAGEGDYALRTGVPIPSGDGTDRIARPGPAAANWLFPAQYTVLPAISPASGIGIVVNGVATDVVTLLYEDRRLDFADVTPAIPDSGDSMTFPDDFEIDDEVIGIEEGDLIRFGNGAMQIVTSVEDQTVHFQADAPSNLNQRDAPQGSVMALRTGQQAFPVLPVSRVRMITYYIGLSSTGMPQLVRRVNYGPERVIAAGVENLQLSWDLVNGVDNPTNVEAFGSTAEGQIRKANVFISGRSHSAIVSNGQPSRASLATQVSLRSMAFVSRYDLEQ